MALQNNGQVVDNSNLKNLGNDCGITGLTLSVKYAYDAAAKTVAIDNQSVLPAGHNYTRFRAKVHDFFGNEVVLENATGADIVATSVATLNTSKPLALTVTLSTDNGIIADGGAYGLQSAGDVAHWDAQKNASNESTLVS